MGILEFLIMAGAITFGGYNLQERYELCKYEKNADAKECDFFYKNECQCIIKECERKHISEK